MLYNLNVVSHADHDTASLLPKTRPEDQPRLAPPPQFSLHAYNIPCFESRVSVSVRSFDRFVQVYEQALQERELVQFGGRALNRKGMARSQTPRRRRADPMQDRCVAA